MGVDWYACEHCGDTFPDAGYFVSCEGCGTYWCSDECAEADGFKPVRDDDDDEIIESTCGHCRGDIISDWDLLVFAMKEIGVEYDELKRKYKAVKNGE
jgi:hypothetical protein